MGTYLGGEGGRVVLFTTWALIFQAFSRAWSMSINSQSLVFSRKIDNRIRHLGWACEHNLNPPPRGFKQPILKSSNAHGLPGEVLNLRIDRRIKSWQSRCDTVMKVHTDFRPYQLTTRFSRLMSYHQCKCAGIATYDFKKISLPRSPLKIERLQVSNHQMRCPLPRDTVN